MKLSQVPKYKFSALKKYMHELLTELVKEEKETERDSVFENEPFEKVLNVKRISADLINELEEKELRKLAEDYISALDELDQEDYFGSEGWRHFLMGED